MLFLFKDIQHYAGMTSFIRSIFGTPKPSSPPPPPPSLKDVLGLNVGSEPVPSEVKLVRTTCYWKQMVDLRQLEQFGWLTYEEYFWKDVILPLAGKDLLVVVDKAPEEDPTGIGFVEFIKWLDQYLPENAVIQVGNELNDRVGLWTPRLGGFNQFDMGKDYALRFWNPLAGLNLKHRLIPTGLTGDPRQFLTGMKVAGANPWAVAVHCYGQPLQLVTQAQVREVYPNVQVWTTEAGSELGQTSDAAQVEDVKRAIAFLRSTPVGDRLYWYRQQGHNNFGLFTDDGTPRPAWDIFKAVIF